MNEDELLLEQELAGTECMYIYMLRKQPKREDKGGGQTWVLLLFNHHQGLFFNVYVTLPDIYQHVVYRGFVQSIA